ncbi:VOC family protein [Streptomyces sp. HNM0574]|uniref:VOC family protein n=1 Tax=Streptomyces sp. HNM0574 TaxID=2714954 RepID=UPI00146D01FC|nr:VOC family protein [Streptomyces sp. HNM0574]NLU70892.1 VOC family protein [Streptomyces sp. HNM0574]
MDLHSLGFAEGEPCWVDVMLSDVEAGRRFYGELFDWSFGPPAEGDGYVTAYLDGRPVAGLFAKPDGRLPTVWTVYLATEDAPSTAERIAEAGGQVLMSPMDVDALGVSAMAADPGGAVFGLWQPGEVSGFGARDRAGAYVWAEVRTRDKEDVDIFYAEVFGYGMRDLRDNGLDFTVWTPKGEPRDDAHAIGGRDVIGPDAPAELPAHFLTYFAVTDCDATVRTAVRLGGRVQREPEDGQYGRIAVLSDNQGATFAVLGAAGAAEV